MSNHHKAEFRHLKDFIAEAMKSKGVPGVAVGVLSGDETYTAGLGVTNIEHPLSVTDETLFQIGSITKTFTGTAVMRLIEMGKLDLDATVRTYLPDFEVADETATSQVAIRHLLTHTSGWVGDFHEDTGAGDDALPEYVARMADLEQLAPVGAIWGYNNPAFSLVGCIIEKVVGKKYEDTLRELIFAPLGLEHCYFGAADVMTRLFAVGHEVGENGVRVARPWPRSRYYYPVGGIVCHVKDLLRYARFHLGDGATQDGTRLLAPETLSLMHTPQVSIGAENEYMGLTWFIYDESGIRELSHGGGVNGQLSLLTLVPEHQFAIAILTNADVGITNEVSQWALNEHLGIQIPKPVATESSGEELASYTARYVSHHAVELELSILSGNLVGQIKFRKGFPSQDGPPPPNLPPMSLALCEKNRLVVLDGPDKDNLMDVIRKPDGTIGWLRWQGRIYRRRT